MLKSGESLRGGYVIDRLLGRGGMGCVYLARQSTLGGRPVAIKELILEGDDMGDAAIAQFKREAQTLGTIEHENLVDVKDFFAENGAWYLVMGFIDGVTLDEIVRDNPCFVPCGLVLEWADCICDVLGRLHGLAPPIIVRDLKPGNVMVDVQGRVRLIDFGIARVVHAGSQTSTYLRGVGTVGYSPLEQYGMGGTDARSDIYSLGATLYAVLTRTVPAWSIGRNTGEETLVPASRLNPAIPRPLEAVLERMLALRADDRYADVGQAREALRHAAAFVPPPPMLPARFCSTCGEPVVAAAGRCHHCKTVFEDAATLFAPLVAAGSGSAGAVVVGAPSLAPPPPPPPRVAPASPTVVAPSHAEAHTVLPRRTPTPAVVVLCGVLAGGLIYGGMVATRPTPSATPAPTVVLATSAGSPLPPLTTASPSPPPAPTVSPTPPAAPTLAPTNDPVAEPAWVTPEVPGGDAVPPLSSPTHVAPLYLMSDSARRPLAHADLAGKDARTLCLIRNEIYARHGRTFGTPAIRTWFEAQAWYRPRSDYRDAVLTPLERRNAQFVLRYEDAHGFRWP